MKKLLYTSLFALMAFIACEKDDETIPSEKIESNWEFTADGRNYKGPIINTALTYSIGGNLQISGVLDKATSPDTVFNLTIQFHENKIDTGIFITENPGTNFSFGKLPSGDIIYAANATQAPPVVEVRISSYDSNTKVVTGTFSGQAYNFDGDNVNILNGAFKTKLK